MTVSVPTTSDVMDSAKTGGMNGGMLVAGETVGRATLGPGVGTLLGGILAASTMSGNDRDIMTTIAVERAGTELLGGA